ncbi:hypothetical protein [Streptomyces cuspidosporus]|uniref:Uncharacterized protein n=1 Tax=Streptomyces cuspidosporus TaxID=66882 RepID=A0ABP5S9T1_9ACTN
MRKLPSSTAVPTVNPRDVAAGAGTEFLDADGEAAELAEGQADVLEADVAHPKLLRAAVGGAAATSLAAPPPGRLPRYSRRRKVSAATSASSLLAEAKSRSASSWWALTQLSALR